MFEFKLNADLRRRLEEKQVFKEVLALLKDEELTLEDVNYRHLLALERDIADVAKAGPEGIQKEGIGSKTLAAILSGSYKRMRCDPRVQKTLNTLIYFITGFKERHQWEAYYLPGRKVQRTVVVSKPLVASSPGGLPAGFWYVYRNYNEEGVAPKIKRSILQIVRKKDGSQQAFYRSVHGITYEGTLSHYHDIFTITMCDPDQRKSIEISACTFDTLAIEGDRVINAMIRSTNSHRRPDANHCILMPAGKDVKSLKTAKLITVSYTPGTAKKNSRKATDRDRSLNCVITYLTRNNVLTMFAKPFDSFSLGAVKQRNAEFFKDNYAYQHLSLKGPWTSLSTLHTAGQAITGMTWSLDIHEASWQCMLTGRTSGKNATECSGAIFFQPHSFTCLLRDKNRKPLIHLVARIGQDNDRINALATALTTDPPVAYRMIFFKGRSRPDTFERSLLEDDRSNHLGWPANPAQEKKNLESLKKFAGNWYAYIPYVYDAPKQKFSRIILHIDESGKATEKAWDPDKQKGKELLVYRGHATTLSNTLRLSNVNQQGQQSEYLFEMNPHSPTLPGHLLGVTLDTDRDSSPCADVCIAFRQVPPFSRLPLKPAIIDRKSKDYPLLLAFFSKHFDTTPEEFYYQTYKSIRKKGKR